MPTTVSLSQMVDLSLGTPEIGSVNFNVMHTLLHAIIRNLRIADVKADIDEHDRDFLASSKIRVGSTLSDADSGQGESEDGISEKSVPPFRPTPYHRMEIKVEKLAQQLEQLNQLPSTNDLFARTTKSKETSENPVADMWQYMQMKKRVDANEEGVGKLFSMVEDMMKQMKELKDENKALQDKLKALDLGDLYKRLNDLENITSELNDQFANLPTLEEFSTFVTWPDLEAALKGLRTEFEPVEPEPVEMQTVESQTEAPSPSRSRPGSSRLSRVSSTSIGPSGPLLDILERLGRLDEDHGLLKARVDDLEAALKGLDLSADFLEQLGKLKAEIDALAASKDKDGDALSRAQHAILQLQSEVEKLHTTTSDIIDENKIRTKEIQDLLAYCDRLQREKADKEYVMMEVEVKADKRALENKVNHKLFDQTTDEINKMIKEILDKLADHEADWKSAYGKLTEDLDGKLDRMELDPLKEWLEARLKALNDKLKKYQSNMEWSEDDAAGIRKQLIQRFHCISCDRPVDMMPTGFNTDLERPQPSLPAQGGLPPTRSPRPYTTFELEQIRQHAKSFAGGTGGQGTGLGTETTDYYATPRPCGGSHTLTYPHKRNTKLTHLSHLFREEEGIVIPIPKEEVDVQGVDGHIYKGRSDLVAPRPPKLEARLPPQLGANNNNLNVNQRPMSPQPPQTRRATTAGKSPLITQQRTRPMSAKTPRPSSAVPNQTPQGSRPTSARVVQSMDESRLDTGEPDPVPQEAFLDQAPDGVDEDIQQTETIQMPSAEETGQ